MQPHDSTLTDKIVELRRKNLIPKRFRVSDVLAVLAGEKEGRRHCERFGDLTKPAAANAVGAILVFLHLLERHADLHG